jgi:hypothetical protein
MVEGSPVMTGGQVDEAADELYGLTPSEFTAARDARAKAAKQAGDKDAAREIKALRKPTVTAWLANQLVRHHAAEVGPLAELGAALREATAALSGPQLRDLSRQRNEVVRALVRQARGLAAEAGQAVSEEVARGLEETLNAALADPAQAELLLQGRLSAQLRHSGYGGRDGAPVGGSTPAATRASTKPRASGGKPPTAAEKRRIERRELLERDLADAWPAARAAADARSAAEQQAVRAEEESRAARRRVDGLRADLAEAEDLLSRATGASAAAAEARDAAAAEADRATRRVSKLQRDLEKG